MLATVKSGSCGRIGFSAPPSSPQKRGKSGEAVLSIEKAIVNNGKTSPSLF
jgi:hypothetical protein